MFAEDAWALLNDALEHYTPGCAGRALFTADSRTDEQRAACSSICARCPIADLCGGYATAAKADFGFCAGIDRAGRKRGRPSPLTTADRTVSGTTNERKHHDHQDHRSQR